MNLLTKAAILAANDLKREAINIEQWGGDVLVRELTAAERDKVVAVYTENPDETSAAKVDRAHARLLAMALIDNEGQPLFSEAEIPALKGKHYAAIIKLTKAASRLAGLESAAEGEKT
jgi:hypothetical protein